jgi:hypothetical protein
MIPQDSRVEIDAKINAGYFTTGKTFTTEELAQVKGRGWEKWEDITVSFFLLLSTRGITMRLMQIRIALIVSMSFPSRVNSYVQNSIF